MALDRELRNELRNTVTRCRRILEETIADDLEGRFAVTRSGKAADASNLGHLSDIETRDRAHAVSHLRHIEASGYRPREAAEQLVREAAYTHLNRLCAYKMLERRRLIRESVGRGIGSNGFMFYLADHPEDEKLWSSGRQDDAYRNFLVWLGGTLSGEIGALFATDDPANYLFPPQRALNEVLGLINADKLDEVWDSEETIGWVYQYYTPKELRDRARKESQAPRNSYELSFRNQFYTPNYVVRFLVDNTLGRTWHEMRQGDTRLTDLCEYLVRQPDEVVRAGDAEQEGGEDRPVPAFVPYRAPKDPREIRVLDPASGSGHFLLYCFDLLEVIYEEAYEAGGSIGSGLREEYPDRSAFLAAVPGMILRHNLHGMDIDVRATQISALALWLRAQRSFEEKGIERGVRPRISRANIVCAEPMPGEREMLSEFVSSLSPKLLGQLVETVFEDMKLAGEAGSLLKIEATIKSAVEHAAVQWRREFDNETDRRGNELLFTGAEMDRISGRAQDALDLYGIDDAEFWTRAEGLVLETLERYAGENGASNDTLTYRRRLFAEDAGRGFAFVEMCRTRFDVVLMNPPFGDASKPSKGYIDKTYPRTKNDMYAAFVERGLSLLHPGGMLGAITSRTGFFLSSFRKWREEIVLEEARPTVVADLGQGVLDTAMVETAAYVLQKTSQT